MKKQATLIIFIFLSLSIFSQTIEELEYELSVFIGGETYNDKINFARKLLQLDPFNEKAIEYTFRYYNQNDIDSISIFFENLINNYPENPGPFILRSELLHLECDYQNKKEYHNWKIKYLKMALRVDSLNKKAIYSISETFYKDFIYPFEKPENFGIFFEEETIDSTLSIKEENVKIPAFEHSADSALKYFYILWQIDSDVRDVIYFPIRQLECFIGKKEISQITDNIIEINSYCYFPSWYFVNLSENWECDYSIDYLFKVKLSKWQANGIAEQLSDLEEPCLFSSKFSDNKEVYRFTWLRSFDNPISIRIEKTESRIELIWKIGKGSGGYEPKGLKRKGKKKLKEHKWNEFINLVNESKFDNLQNQRYIPMNDGASWILEHKMNSSFKAHETNWPYSDFKECCLYLLELSGINVKEEDIY